MQLLQQESGKPLPNIPWQPLLLESNSEGNNKTLPLLFRKMLKSEGSRLTAMPIARPVQSLWAILAYLSKIVKR